MTATQYHRVLVGLDQALFAIREAAGDLNEDEVRLRERLEMIRSQILKAESGHPFPFKPSSVFGTESDHDMTRAPWFS